MEGHVRTETHRGITTISFFSPQGNSLPLQLLNQLIQAVHGAGNDDATLVIVLKSEGKNFCAGASFEELQNISDAQQGQTFFNGFGRLINVMRKCPKFIIGRIHGRCVGGGVGLAAACDYTVALDVADLKLTELTLGIGPFVVGPVVERRIGTAAFAQLAVNAWVWRSAEWGRKKGIYSELHATIDGLDEAVEQLSDSLSRSNPQSMAELKKVLWAGTEHWDTLLKERAAISGRLVLSSFTRDAIKRFKSKVE